MTEPYLIRRATAEDVALVSQTFVRGAMKAHKHDAARPALERLLAARLLTGDVFVAAAEDVIVGYCIAQSDGPTTVVHWLWTKERYRRWGVAKRLWGHVTAGASSAIVTHAPAAWHRAKLRAMGVPVREALAWILLLSEDEGG
jgi:ribosomal protein S18 acetylase RimI-like enzyme